MISAADRYFEAMRAKWSIRFAPIAKFGTTTAATPASAVSPSISARSAGVMPLVPDHRRDLVLQGDPDVAHRGAGMREVHHHARADPVDDRLQVAADRDQATATGQVQILLAGVRRDAARQVEGVPAPGQR